MEISESRKTILALGMAFLLGLVLMEFLAIRYLNFGFFTYTLDDPYIHLALAENIRHGHYGINGNEFSAPSSSIVWPFLLAPFAGASFGVYVPLIINLLCAIATVLVFFRVIEKSLDAGGDAPASPSNTWLLILILFVVCTNTAGLVFTGMEHSLQLLLAATVALGLIIEARDGRVPVWLLLAIIAGPLVRYENLAIAAAALAYLGMRGHYKQAAGALAGLMAPLVAFSAFLASLGLGSLPTSVLAKSSVVGSQRGVLAVFSVFFSNLSTQQGFALAVALICLLAFVFFSNDAKKRLLAAAGSAAIALHLAAGSVGMFNRYEIYAWGFALPILFHLAGAKIASLTSGTARKEDRLKFAAMALIATFLFFGTYVSGLVEVPFGANNIFEQHYQMHRFAVDYYRKPVAVNDLGYVCYRNENYVLDLWGLGSIEALRGRTGARPGWMSGLVASKDVKLVMLYYPWLQPEIPRDWIVVGQLHLGKPNVTAALSTVTFFATDEATYREVMLLVPAFQQTLPPGVVFRTTAP